MIFRKIWYESVKLYVKVSLQFYTKKIRVFGKENIPKKGAILFAVNHPNALMDPLFVTTSNGRENHFLVRADVFKKPLIKKALESLNLMPIYRIRDGRKQLSNNDEIFEKCFSILNKQQTLIIFPQGGHCRDRTIQPLSKGFTRIIFGALEKYKTLEIAIIPVGITYQNSSTFPSKVCVKYGEPIYSRKVFDTNTKAKSIIILKDEVRNQLKKLTVHIPNDENYATTLSKLNAANVDFTKVDFLKNMIAENKFPEPKNKQINFLKPLYFLIMLNSIFPFILWKKVFKNNKEEIEFIDTMRYAINMVSFPIFYLLQALIIGLFYGFKIALIYFIISFLMVFMYTKLSPTNTENS